MIRENAFNSGWWGSPVGFVESPAFFSLPPAQQQAALAPYAWAEFRSPLGSAPSLAAVARAGFVQFDTQLEFRIGLQHIQSAPSLDDLSVCFADERPFVVTTEGLASFRHERYMHLPGATPQKLDERYRMWANELIATDPAWCVEISYQTQPQGWFLAGVDDTGLHLALAMAHRDARVSGMYVYHKALLAYARRGARIGHAGFSICNVAVHNIYARLGATFVQPVGCWLWVRLVA
jgi:hypothetical protein